jgi:hypothetical protein
MPRRATWLFRAALVASALSLSACGQAAGDNDLANLDNQLAGNDVDPALTSALEDQILVDPALANQSNKNAVRPPATPMQAQYPVNGPDARTPQPGSGATAATSTGQASSRAEATQHARLASAARGEGGTGCGGSVPFDYNLNWANRLPAAFAVYPGSRVTEAAGNDGGECRVRVVTFTSRDAPARLLAFYRDRATRAGYSAEQQTRGADLVLGGTNEVDGAAFYLIVTPLRSGGSDVALIANNGR